MATVDNDFHQTHSIFRLFDGLEVPDMDKIPSHSSTGPQNGHTTTLNGDNGADETLNQTIKKETHAAEAQADKGMTAPYT